jgi:hypothetical protein
MTELIAEFSHRVQEKTSFVVQPIVAAALGVVVFVRAALALRAEAAATASIVLGSEPAIRLGVIANLIGAGFYGLLTLVFRYALVPAKTSVALLGAYFHFLRHAGSVAGSLVHVAPMIVQSGAHTLVNLIAAL